MINVAVLWLVDGTGNILLAQRSHLKAQDPSIWGPSVTGKLEPGENFDQALAREVEEELALKPSDYQPHFLFEKVFDHPDKEQRKFGAYYAVFPKDKTAGIKVDPAEVAGVAWFSLEEILERMKSAPEELVPSAEVIWPATFDALRSEGVL